MNSGSDSRALQTSGEKLSWWNIPNTITTARIVLTIFLFVTLAFHKQLGYLPSLVLFVVAAGTDWLDGFLARRLHQVTSLGRVLDPFADKLIICGTFVFLAADPKMLETPGGLHPLDRGRDHQPRTADHGIAELPGRPDGGFLRKMVGEVQNGVSMRSGYRGFSLP
ncbi:MAG: hypothetical protein KatS3mg112_1542 [Thermogutta sp.]|nr:MAG: hypothetical protein KatS3mg112_1542 [Thermogutta sp.]